MGAIFVAEFRQRVLVATGVACEAILLAASHAHSTPATIGSTPLQEVEKAAEWVNTLLDQVGRLRHRCMVGQKNGDIVWVNFSCHPAVVQVNDLISADYVGALMRFVETHLPQCRMCLFAQSACGDVNTVDQTTSDFTDAELYGMALAGEVIKQVALLRLHYGHLDREAVAQTFRRISV